MNQKTFSKLIIFIFLFALFINPQSESLAQGGCFDAAGGPIPCPDTDVEVETTKIFTPVPITNTFTATNTFTSTPSQTPSPTLTATHTPTLTFTPTFTLTPSSTPTVTPIPPANIVLPGAGIGALILFLIVGVLFPIIQRIRVRRRGY